MITIIIVNLHHELPTTSDTIKHFTFFVPILQMKNRQGRLKNLSKFIKLVSDRAKPSSWAWLWSLCSPHFTLLFSHMSQMPHEAALLARGRYVMAEEWFHHAGNTEILLIATTPLLLLSRLLIFLENITY